MITWIQLVLQKHHKSVFSVLLVVIIIAFVFTIGQVPFLGDRNRNWDTNKEFYGFDMSNAAVVQNFQFCVYYESLFNGAQINNEQQFSQMVYRQAYLLSVARDFDIRQVTQAEFNNYVESSPAFQNQGKFDPAIWNKFKSERLASGSLTDDILTSIIMQNALVAKMDKLLGGPGYIFKSYADEQYNKIYGSWSFNIATISYDSFKPEIKFTDKELEEYFKANIEQYRIGEGVVLETVFFPAANYSKEVKLPSESEIAAYYGANMRKYASQKDGKPYVPQLAEVKETVKADMLLEASLQMAHSAAEELAMSVYGANAKFGSPQVQKVFADAKVSPKKSGIIRTTDKTLPQGIPMQVASIGLQLDQNNFFTDPVAVSDGAWFVMLSQKVDSYLPKFVDVKKEVQANYLEAQKQKLFSEKGVALDASIKKALAEGKSFESAAKSAGAKIESIKDFCFATGNSNMSQEARMGLSVASSMLEKMKVGEVSNMQTIAGNGYIVNLVKFTPPTKTSQKSLDDMYSSMEKTFGAFSASTVVSDMINKAMPKKAQE